MCAPVKNVINMKTVETVSNQHIASLCSAAARCCAGLAHAIARRRLAWLVLAVIGLLRPGAASASDLTTKDSTNAPIAWAELGARATAQYSGDGLAVTPTAAGTVRLRCTFQKLEGEATREGLWLTSTADPAAADRFRLVAAVVVADAGASYPVRIDPTFSGAQWTSMGTVVGADSMVYCYTEDTNGNLYMGGSFSVIGTNIVLSIAKWDGTRWSALGTGLSGTVYAMAFVGTNLYAGGSFNWSPSPSGVGNGTFLGQIGKWNGTTWSALGGGLNTTVRALAVSDTNLYVGGDFTTAGSSPSPTITANRIAMWNGSAWSALGTGAGITVKALAVLGGNLYICLLYTSPSPRD